MVTWHVQGNLQLPEWEGSNSQGNASREARVYGFFSEQRMSFPRSHNGRALCVRRSGD